MSEKLSRVDRNKKDYTENLEEGTNMNKEDFYNQKADEASSKPKMNGTLKLALWVGFTIFFISQWRFFLLVLIYALESPWTYISILVTSVALMIKH